MPFKKIPFWSLGVSLFLIHMPLFFGYRDNTAVTALGSLLLLLTLIHFYKNQQLLLLWEKTTALLTKRTWQITLWLMGLGWVGVAISYYYGFGFAGLDDVAMINPLVNYLETGNFYSTLLQQHQFSDHLIIHSFLFLPFVSLYKTFLWLTFAKILAYLVSSWCLYKIAKFLFPNQPHWHYFFPLLWLLHAYVGAFLLFSFQYSNLAPPFILISFYLALQKRYKTLLIPMLFLLGFKENMPFFWMSMGCFLFFMQGQKRWGIFYFALAIVIGLSMFFYIMPLFQEAAFISSVSRFGPTALIPEKIEMVFKGLLSFGFLPLLYPQTLLFILPAFGLALAANLENHLLYIYHYQDVPLTVLAFAAIYALHQYKTGNSWLSQYPRKQTLAKLLVGWTLVSMHPLVLLFGFFDHAPSQEKIKVIQEFADWKKKIPAPSTILTTEHTLPYFVEFPSLYYLKNQLETALSAPQENQYIFLYKPEAKKQIHLEKYLDRLEQAHQNGQLHYLQNDSRVLVAKLLPTPSFDK